jgi:hypothetical protein
MGLQILRNMNIKDFKKKWELPQIVSRLRCCLVSLGVIDDVCVLNETQLRNTKNYR